MNLNCSSDSGLVAGVPRQRSGLRQGRECVLRVDGPKTAASFMYCRVMRRETGCAAECALRLS